MKIKRAGKKLFRMNRLEDRLYVLGICVPLMMTMFFLMFRALPGFVREFFLVPCVFHAVTGLYCPGCGGTRAAAVLFQGEILRSFFYCGLYGGALCLVYDFSYGGISFGA